MKRGLRQKFLLLKVNLQLIRHHYKNKNLNHTWLLLRYLCPKRNLRNLSLKITKQNKHRSRPTPLHLLVLTDLFNLTTSSTALWTCPNICTTLHSWTIKTLWISALTTMAHFSSTLTRRSSKRRRRKCPTHRDQMTVWASMIKTMALKESVPLIRKRKERVHRLKWTNKRRRKRSD